MSTTNTINIPTNIMNGTLLSHQAGLLQNILLTCNQTEISITPLQIHEYCHNNFIHYMDELAFYCFLYGVHENICANANDIVTRNNSRMSMMHYDTCVQSIEEHISNINIQL